MKARSSILLSLAMVAGLAACSPKGQEGAATSAAAGQPLTLDLTSKTAPRELGSGWSGPEGVYTWTDGHVAELNLAKAPSGGALLTVTAAGYGPVGGAQPVDVMANGTKVAHWQVAVDTPAAYEALIPAQAIQAGPVLRVQFLLPNAAQPVPGGRLLGLSVRRITLGPAPSDKP